jgi:hypothetical protein
MRSLLFVSLAAVGACAPARVSRVPVPGERIPVASRALAACPVYVMDGVRIEGACGASVATQAMSAAGIAGAAIPADAKDIASVDAIIAALYEANTSMIGEKGQADRFRSLFASGAILAPTSVLPNGTPFLGMITPGEYAARALQGQPGNGYSEREIARRTEAFGNIMQVFSTYETRRSRSDRQPTRGINSIQLFHDGNRWWIVSVLWDNERPGAAIPQRYLPRP